MPENGLQIGVLADDLTGALASAARLRDRGLRPLVRWSREDVPAEADALVADMRTRDGRETPGLQAREWSAHLRALGCRRFELRSDSSLRGSIADELEGLLAGVGFRDPWVLAVPAFPDAGRTTVDGAQRIAGTGEQAAIDVGERVFRGSSSTIVRRDCIESGEQGVVSFMQRQADLGARSFIADATHDLHLSTMARAADLLEDAETELVTVSPGAWLKYHPQRARPRPGFVLVVLSSPTEQNRAQLDELVTQTSPTVLDPSTDPEGRIEAGEPNQQVVVVETITAPGRADDRGGDLARSAARSAASILDGSRRRGERCAGLVVSGGYTATCLTTELRAAAIRAASEVRPLCGAGTLIGGDWDGLRIVTKGGLVGEPATLTELVMSLRGDLAGG